MRAGLFDWKALLVAIAAAGGGIWFLQPGAAGTLDGQVAALAERMRGLTPRQMADGSTLRSVTAAGGTMVLTIDGRAPWQADRSDEEATTELAIELCAVRDVRDLIERGGQVRIDRRTLQGEQLQILPVDRCAQE
jgi:hypothetical protein